MTRHPITQRHIPLALAGDRPDSPVTAAPQPVEDPALVSPLNPYGTARVATVLEAVRRRERVGAPQADADSPRGYVVPCACGCGVEFRSFWGQRYASHRCRRRLNQRHERERRRERITAALAAAPEVRSCACGCGATFRLETRANGSHRRIYFDARCARRANIRVERERRRAMAFGGAV